MRSLHTAKGLAMATWFRTSSGDPDYPGDAASSGFDHWEPDAAYLTDGTHLYRYLGAVPSGTSELGALEDCLTLTALLFSLDDVGALRLRGVVPAEEALASRHTARRAGRVSGQSHAADGRGDHRCPRRGGV